MLIEQVKKLSPLQRFVYWIKERHAIWFKRQNGEPKPWTDDTVLQTVFFTNPYRELDKVTVWFRENVRDPLKNKDEIFFATIAFRFFTWIPTGELLLANGWLEKWEPRRVVACLGEVAARGKKVFTGAYVISNCGSTKPKVQYIVEDCITPIWDRRKELLRYASYPECLTMQGMHHLLSGLPGLGGFMAYEVVCDLRYTKFLNKATDKLTWCNPGPGARRGLNRLLGLPLKNRLGKQQWAEETQHLLEKVQTICHQQAGMPRFEMREIEHSLCEFFKYEKALWPEQNLGHVKRMYNGT